MSDEIEAPTIGEIPSAKAGTEPARPRRFSLLYPTGTPVGSSSTRSASTVASTGEAMLTDEILRARVFGCVITAFALLTFVVVMLLDGNPTAKLVFASSLAAYTLASGTLTVALYRRPESYSERNLIILAVLALPCSYTGLYFWGFFSPAAVVVVMALYFNSLVGGFIYTLIVYLANALVQGGLAALIIFDVVPDVGLIRAESATIGNEVLTQVLVQAVLLATFVLGRLSRRATQATISELDQAVRGIAQREALLQEARQELERAAWMEGPGRFSDQTFGSYRLGEVIGRGAMGEVYEAENLERGEPAAVKLLQRAVLSRPDIVERFARESVVAMSITSPHVARVLETGDEPLPYIAMERLRGVDLAAYLRQRRLPSTAEVSTLVSQLARGVEAARAAGVIHRDLKPHNVFRIESGAGLPLWKILDFGVSKLTGDGGSLTAGKVVGTPAYMAPEQALGDDIDFRVDVYALGAIAYRALTGQPPYSAADTARTLHAVAYRRPIRPSEIRESLLDDVDRVLAIVLARDREDRFETASEFARAFESAVSGELSSRLRRRARSILDKHPWDAIVLR